MDVRGFDSSRILISRAGILKPTGFPGNSESTNLSRDNLRETGRTGLPRAPRRRSEAAVPQALGTPLAATPASGTMSVSCASELPGPFYCEIPNIAFTSDVYSFRHLRPDEGLHMHNMYYI